MQPKENPTRPLTVLDFAVAAGVHPITVDRAIRDGVLKVEWERGRRTISRDQLPEFVAGIGRRRHQGAPAEERAAAS
jgi:hypothetical protein